jgi:hypothetical protein
MIAQRELDADALSGRTKNVQPPPDHEACLRHDWERAEDDAASASDAPDCLRMLLGLARHRAAVLTGRPNG